MDDFDDFFDSPRRPSSPSPRQRRNSLSTDEDDFERNSVLSSARSGASIKIEARVPSIASDIQSGSEDESPRYSASSKPPRPSSSKRQRDRHSNDSKTNSSNNHTRNKTNNAWVEFEEKPRGKKSSSQSKINEDCSGNLARGERRRRSYSDTDSDSSSSGSSRNSHSRSRKSDKSSRNSHSTHSRSHSRSDYSKSRSRSSSSSSEWSTGSSDGDRRSKTPRTPRNVYEKKSNPSKQQKNSGSQSDDTLSISSLSESEIDTARPASRSTQERPAKVKEEVEDKDKMDLHRLLSALLESEEDSRKYGKKGQMIISPQNHKQVTRANYTFTNDRAKMIDMENQRLLQNILSQRNQSSSTGKQNTSTKVPDKKKNIRVAEPPRITHASLNRMREQQRVERENLALLRRLNQIKPSAEISRTKQLESYKKQMSYHCPQMREATSGLGTTGYRSKSAYGMPATTSTSSSTSGGKRRPASASYATRPSSAKSSGRPSSATAYLQTATHKKPRPTSAKTRPKPEWETGW